MSLNQSISFGASKRSRPDTDDLQLDDDAIAPSASASEASAARKAGQQQPADGTPADGSAARGPRKVRSRKEGGDFTGDDSKQVYIFEGLVLFHHHHFSNSLLT